MSQPGRIGAFKTARTSAMTADDAETLAATALGALAQDASYLSRFMTDTGLTPEDLRTRAGDRDVLVAVLEHVAGDESLLLVVTSNLGSKPETLMQALHILQAPGHWSS